MARQSWASSTNGAYSFHMRGEQWRERGAVWQYRAVVLLALGSGLKCQVESLPPWMTLRGVVPVLGDDETLTVTVHSLDERGNSQATATVHTSGDPPRYELKVRRTAYLHIAVEGAPGGILASGQVRAYVQPGTATSLTANVNWVTHLLQPRIHWLVSNDGESFADAQNQAESELTQGRYVSA